MIFERLKDDLNYFLIFGFFLILILSFLANKLLKKNKQENDKIKQNIVALERQRISSELHDEIGSGIYSIKLYTDLAIQKRPEINEIKELGYLVDDLAIKIKEVIWSTNSESDNLESLIYYLEERIRNMFEHSSISCKIILPSEIPNIAIDNTVKRNVYLMVKEMCHNVLKHSSASLAELKITASPSQLVCMVKDNGIGFNPTEININSMGISNLKSRAKILNAKLIMETYKGTTVSVSVPL